MKFVKFLKVHHKRAFRNDDLFHIIYAEESTYFIVNFEGSEHSLAANPDLKIYMNRKENNKISYLESGFICKYQEVYNIYENMQCVLPVLSFCVFLRSAFASR